MSLATSLPSQQRSIDRLLAALDAQGFKYKKMRGDEFMAQCPVHADKTPSLHISYSVADERTDIYCMACGKGAWADILASLGLPNSALFDKPLERKDFDHTPRKSRKPRKPTKAPLPARLIETPEIDEPEVPKGAWQETVYSYADETGTIRHETVKLEASVDGQRVKRFFQRFAGASGAMVKRKPAGFEPVLYNHADVLQAIAAGRPVYVVEGEKDADSATAAGLVATTNAMGATSFPAELAELLAGGDLHIVVDRDLAGAQRAKGIYDLFENLDVATDVTLYMPATTELKSDLTDHLDAGFSIKDLVQITPDDAEMFARAEEVEKLVSKRMQEVVDEARARFERDDTAEYERWVEEARDLLELVNEKTSAGHARGKILSPVGEAAAAKLAELRRRATRMRGEAENVIPITPAVRFIAGGGDDDGGDDEDIYDGSSEDDGVFIKRPIFKVIDGDTARVTFDRDGNKVHTLIMNGWAVVEEVGTFDDGENAFDDPDALKPSRAKDFYRVNFYARQRDEDGRLIRASNGRSWAVHKRTLVFDRDAIRSGAWFQMLPAENEPYAASPKARSDVWEAITKARPIRHTADRCVYNSPGWRTSDFGVGFVHAGGMITAKGVVDVPTRFDAGGLFKGYRLPEPTDDKDQLREAWNRGVTPLVENLPARILVPLLTAVWGSVFNRTPLVTECSGARAAVKTGTVALINQFLTPVIYHGGGTRKAQLSGTDSGSSALGIPLAASTFGHVSFIIDDFAPDEAPEKVRKKQTDFKRAYYDAPARVVGTRDQGAKQNKPIVGTPILTGEMTSSGSVATRTFKIPMSPGDIKDPQTLYPQLEKKERREARGLLGATLIQHIARHFDELHERWQDSEGIRPQMVQDWVKRLHDAPYDPELRGRFAEDLATRHHAARIMLEMMLERGAMNEQEAHRFEQWVVDGLHEAAMLQESVAGDPGLQTLALLREALLNGSAFISNKDLSAPADEIAGSLGWTPSIVFGDGKQVWATNARDRIGFVNGDRLLLLPSSTVKVAKAAATASGDTLSETALSIGSSFIAHGWMERDKEGKQSVRRWLNGSAQRVWDIPLVALLDPDRPAGPAGGTRPEPDNGPSAPTLDFDSDVAATPPVAAPAQEAAAATKPQAPAADTKRPAAAAQPSPIVTSSAPVADGHEPFTTIPPVPAKGHVFRAAVGVLDTKGLWLPDGTMVNLADTIGTVHHLGSFVHLVHQLNMGAWIDGWQVAKPTIYLTREAALRLQVPVDRLPKYQDEWQGFLKANTANNPLLTAAIAAGWSVGGGDDETAAFINSSTTVWMKTAENTANAYHVGVNIALLDALRDDFDPIITEKLADGTEAPLADPIRIAQRLQKLADVGLPFKVSASTTTSNVLKATLRHDKRSVFLTPSRAVDPARDGTGESDFNWTRTPNDSDRALKYVHAFDRGGSYLAAMAGLNFGAGNPSHVIQNARYVPGKQAYYRVTVPESPLWGLPHPFGRWARNRVGEDLWVAAPTVELALDPKLDLNLDFEILEAYIWDDSARYLNKLYETLRDARKTLDTGDPDDEAARDVVKAMYTRTVGMWGSEHYMKDRDGYAPERRHAVIAKSRANLYRKVHRIGTETGTWPLAMQTDSVLYASDEADGIKAWPGTQAEIGRGLGQFKLEASVLLDDHVDYFTGETYHGKKALGLPDE